MKSVIPLKVRPRRQSLEKGLLGVFQATDNIPCKDAESARLSRGNRAQSFRLKEKLPYGVRFVCLCYKHMEKF